MRMNHHLAVFVPLALALATSEVHADSSYRKEVAAADLASAATFGVGAALLASDDAGTTRARIGVSVLIAGLLGSVVIPPAVHLANDNKLAALGSLGAHVVIPLLTGAVATRGGFVPRNAFWGVLAGIVVASAIDIAIATRDEDPAARTISFGARF